MKFTWDPKKRLTNLKKHDLDFFDAERVFSGHTVTFPDNRFRYEEMRFITVGLLEERVVAIAHTEIENTIRIFSMRAGERYERELYFTSF
ncbi:MAG: BrnT family toxin [Candidatus Accumulibacter sp.]|jgi:uncharacterized DUF497 family protein|nr:BrnT family toxin [Accumulibacter sp.]